jgi:hypothetical protein
MRNLAQGIIVFVFVALLGLTIFLLPAKADNVFFYMDDHGTYSFTDDVLRVPEAYTPVILAVNGMDDYERFTRDDYVAPLRTPEHPYHSHPLVPAIEPYEAPKVEKKERRRKRHRSDRKQ